MPSFEAEFEVWCSKCGAGICNNLTNRRSYNRQANAGFDCEPCETCLQNARDEGHDEGYQEGYDAAMEEAEKSLDIILGGG